MNRRIKSTWSRLSGTLQVRLRRLQAPSIDSLLKSLMISSVLTPEHLGVIHNTSTRSVLRVLKAATELERPLVRSVGPDTSGPLQQCYLLTEAGRERAERQLSLRAAHLRAPATAYLMHQLLSPSDRARPGSDPHTLEAIRGSDDPSCRLIASIMDRRRALIQRPHDERGERP